MIEGNVSISRGEPIIRFRDIIGNVRPKDVVGKYISIPAAPQKIILCGPTGSGKSTTIELAVAYTACFKPQGKDPCGRCNGCKEHRRRHSAAGYFEPSYNTRENPVDFAIINCRNTTAASLHKRLEDLRWGEGRRIIHLEEAASLKRLQCDESITDLMDDPDFADCHWFATAVSDHGLDAQFRRRWTVKLLTSPPTPCEAASLLARRCRERGIFVDDVRTLELLAKRAWYVMGLALAPLDGAALSENALTHEMVKNYPFPEVDPWNRKFYET